MAKEKRPAWFKVFLHNQAGLKKLPDEQAGRVFKAMFEYFDNRKVEIELNDAELCVFASFQQYIDESFEEYEKSVENGKKKNSKRPEEDQSPREPLRGTEGD